MYHLSIWPASFAPLTEFMSFQFHDTICPEGGLLQPVTVDENIYGCHVCCKRGSYASMVAHVQTHERTAVKHNGNSQCISWYKQTKPVTVLIVIKIILDVWFLSCARFWSSHAHNTK